MQRNERKKEKYISLLNSTFNFTNEYYECSNKHQNITQMPKLDNKKKAKAKLEFIRNEEARMQQRIFP